MSALQAGSLRKPGCADCPSRAAGLIFQADSLGTGSRFRSVESSSFKVQLKCHLLGKDSSSPETKLIALCAPAAPGSLQESLIAEDSMCVFTSLSFPLTELLPQVPCRSPGSLRLRSAVHTVGAQ